MRLGIDLQTFCSKGKRSNPVERKSAPFENADRSRFWHICKIVLLFTCEKVPPQQIYFKEANLHSLFRVINRRNNALSMGKETVLK